MSNSEHDKGLFSEVFDRIRNPFLAGFVISWCIINYQFLMVAFCEESINWKIGTIEEMYPTLGWTWWGKFIFGPAASALFLRLLSHLYKLIDKGLEATTSPAISFLDEVSFKEYKNTRSELDLLKKTSNEKNVEIHQLSIKYEALKTTNARLRQQIEKLKSLHTPEIKRYCKSFIKQNFDEYDIELEDRGENPTAVHLKQNPKNKEIIEILTLELNKKYADEYEDSEIRTIIHHSIDDYLFDITEKIMTNNQNPYV